MPDRTPAAPASLSLGSSAALIASGIPNLLPSLYRSLDTLHISDIIHSICLENGYYTLDSSPPVSKMQLGLSLEYAIAARYAAQFPGAFHQVGEITGNIGASTGDCDSVYGSPDLVCSGGGPFICQRSTADYLPESWIIDINPDGTYTIVIPDNSNKGSIDEIKLTWQSSRDAITHDKYWKRWAQLAAYCYMWQTDVGRLHMCHVNGDYKIGDSEYYIYEVRFTGRELRENWALLSRHGERMLREGFLERKQLKETDA